jgi:hypothetical protein
MVQVQRPAAWAEDPPRWTDQLGNASATRASIASVEPKAPALTLPPDRAVGAGGIDEPGSLGNLGGVERDVRFEPVRQAMEFRIRHRPVLPFACGHPRPPAPAPH